MKEKLEKVKEALKSCEIISGGYECVFDEDKVEEALAILDSLIAELDSGELVEKIAREIYRIEPIVLKSEFEELTKKKSKK